MKKTHKQMENYTLESNQEFHDNFVKTHYNQPQKTKSKIWIWSGAVALVAVCIVCLVVFLPLLGNDGQPPKHYLLENEKVIDSTIDELNQELSGSVILIDTNTYSIIVQKFYDSVSNDILYFQLKINSVDTIENITVLIYTNKDYLSRRQVEKDTINTAQLNGKDMLYNHTFTKDEYGICNHVVVAQSQQKDFYLYVEYGEFSIDEQTKFFSFVNELVTTK